MPAHILIADDDTSIRGTLAALCRAAGHRTSEAGTGRETIEAVAAGQPDLVLLDLDMPEGSGLEILPALIERERPPSVVVLTGYADVRTAVQAIQRGAANLLEKPVDGPDLLEVIERVLSNQGVARERDRLRDEIKSLRSGPIVGQSKAVQIVLEHIQRVANTPRTTVLIGGESGVGKELVARAVHDESARRDAPFVAVNCAAIADGLLEAELFGYEPGAFTGGKPKGHDGLIAAADGGTLFLDEIGELDPTLQAKLLRVLQERTYRRVGGNVDLQMDVRVVASTNRDLVTMVEEGRFREDLYYRLNVLSIVVPPLRERREDIARIATHFLAQFATDLGRRFSGFSEAAMERLTLYSWPGNVRELRNTIERAVILAPEGRILPQHLGLERELVPAERSDPSKPSLHLASWALRDMEQALIEQVLTVCEGNRSRAARELGINRTTLYNKLKQYGLET